MIPALARVPATAYAWSLWPAVGLLPPAIREGYGFRWGPLERAVSGWLVTAWRIWRPFLPEDVRQMPQALAGDRRARSLVAAARHEDAGTPSQTAVPS